MLFSDREKCQNMKLVFWDICLQQMSKKYYKMIESNSDYERNQAQALKSVSNEDHPCLKSGDKCCQHETQNTTFFTESLHLYGSVLHCIINLLSISDTVSKCLNTQEEKKTSSCSFPFKSSLHCNDFYIEVILLSENYLCLQL